MIIPEYVNIAINYVLESENVLEALRRYDLNSEYLHECRFILFSDEYGADIPYFLKSQELENFKIHSLTSYSKMFVIDRDTCDQMLKIGKADFIIDCCIALDTQAVSYLKDLFTENDAIINNGYKEVIDYIIKNDINYDYSLYMWENSVKLNSENEIIKTYQNLLSCERFNALDRDIYLNKGLINYNKTNQDIMISADNLLHNMNIIANNPYLANFRKRYDAIKLILLKVAIIEFKYPKKGLKYKIKLLLEFINKQLGCIMEREIAICYLFLARDTRVKKFFKKIKSNCPDILKYIDGMAWDLNHLRYLEYAMASFKNKNKNSMYELCSIITFDYGLQEVLEAYPIKRCAIYKDIFLPVFETPLYNLIKEIENLQDYMYSTKEIRMNTFKNIDYKILIYELERELMELMKV